MLLSLGFQNIPLLNSQELAFQEGFTVITGETGAGKSILIDSLDLLLGGAQSSITSRFFNSDAKFFAIEATFLITPNIKIWLNKNQIDIDDNEFLISREWHLKDERFKSKCRINGIYLNKNQIVDLRQYLIEFTSQGFSSKINSTSKQLEFLDIFGDEILKPVLSKVNKSWQLWTSAASELEHIKSNWEDSQKIQQESVQILQDLEDFDLHDPNEELKLQNEQDRLANSVNLKLGLNKLISCLKEGNDEFPSVLEKIGDSMHDLKGLTNIDNSLVENYNKIFDIYNYVKDFADSLDQYNLALESDPHRLDDIQARLESLKRVQIRYGKNLAQLITHRNTLRDASVEFELEEALQSLNKKEQLFRIQRDNNFQELSSLRNEIAHKFETKLIKILSPLGLPNVRFKIEIKDTKPSEKGKDLVQFLFSANPGQPLLPLSKIASGGEMSRFVLALKAILSSLDTDRTFIYDEIDSGVSGRISKALASLLKELSINSQVFCITHQPLVASIADHHLHVSKSVKSGITSSKVKYLNDFGSRQNELAELAGGDQKEAMLYAASLLEHKAA